MKFSIVIPTINRADLLKENYADLIQTGLLDASEGLVIIDNGQQDLSFIDHPKVTIFKEPKNLGVAGSWNKGIKYSFDSLNSTHAIVLNDDIVFGKTSETIKQIIENYPEESFFVTSFYWSIFIIPKVVFSKVGEFDSEFFPAYFEDNDYAYRMLQHSIGYIVEEKLLPAVKRNSQTIKKDPGLNSNFLKNQERFLKKWGGLPGQEKFTKPFNIEKIMSIEPQKSTPGSLAEIALKYPTDKEVYHGYCNFYEENLKKKLKIGKGTLLEIGVFAGGSLQTWAEWLPNLKIEGWDINISNYTPDPNSNITVKKLDATIESEVLAELGPDKTFRAIIDDGSHQWADQRETFRLLWPRTKIYILEDIHTAINQGYNKGGIPVFNPKTKTFDLPFGDVDFDTHLFQGKPDDSWTVIFIKKA